MTYICIRLLAVALLWLSMAAGATAQDKPKIEIVPQIPHSFGYLVGGVLARRQAGAVGQLGQNDQALGCGERAAHAQLRGALCWSVRWRSRPMAGKCCRAARQHGQALGRGERAAPAEPSRDTLMGSVRWRSRPTASRCCRAAMTRQSSSGMPRVESSCAPSRGTRIASLRWRSRPMGAQVLSGSEDKTVKLWDAASGELLRTFEGHSDAVTSVAFSPDGRQVLSGSHDNTVKLWDAASGQLVRTFEGHSDTVNSVAFSPDGASVLSGSAGQHHQALGCGERAAPAHLRGAL